MHVLELRSKSLSFPEELIHIFTTHLHDKHLSAQGVSMRTFTKDWDKSDARDNRSFERSAGEYVWTYSFPDATSLAAFISHDSRSRAIGAALASGVVRQYEIDDNVFKAPIIILSAPRAGSTLLYELLTQCSALWSIRDESHHVLEGIPDLRPESRGYGSHGLDADDVTSITGASLRAGFLVHMRDHAGQRYVESPRESIRFVEKTPRNAFRIPFLNALFPDALFVFLRRDPVESISSMMELWENKEFHRSINLPGWSGPKGFRWCMALPPGWRAVSSKPTAEIAAFQWQGCNDAIVEGLITLPRHRWCTIDYAELLANPQREIQQLCEFAQIPFDDGLAKAVSGRLAPSSRVISAPSRDKVQKNRAAIEPVLPGLKETVDRLARLGG